MRVGIAAAWLMGGVLALDLAGARHASAQGWRPTTKLQASEATRATPRRLPAPFDRLRPSTRLRTRAPWATASLGVAATVTEGEPNDDPAQANLVSLGDTIEGVIGEYQDLDFFAIDLTAGVTLDLDVDASQFGSPLDPVIGLFDRDSVTLLAVNDDRDGLDSRLLYAVPADGRYFAAIVGYGGQGGPNHWYRFSLGRLVLDEQEPNDAAATAGAIALTGSGDTLLGTALGMVGAPGDVDYYAVDVAGPGILEVWLTADLGDWFDGRAAVLAGDGQTVLDSVTPYEGSARAWIGATGRYYVAVREAAGGGAPGWIYQLTVRRRPAAPGDPATTVVAGVQPTALAADESGGLYLLAGDGRLLRVGPTGGVTTVTTNLNAIGLALDGLGDLLLSGYAGPSYQAGIWRLQNGALELVASLGSAGPLTVGPDGDLWVVDCSPTGCPTIRRLDPLGRPKDAFDVGAAGWPAALAFSPGGDLHFSTGGAIYRLVNRSAQLLVSDPSGWGNYAGLAFDRDGYLYVARPGVGVALYDASYAVVADPFAEFGLDQVLALAFGRDANGAMTARLFAGDVAWPSGGVAELNPAAIRAPGHRVGTDLLRMLTSGLAPATVGADYADTLEVEDVPGPQRWRVTGGALPPGLTLEAATGIVRGIPSDSGLFQITVQVDVGDRFGIGVFDLLVSIPAVSLTGAVNALLGVPGAISPDLERYLDLQGNRNGRYDIGDLQAFLRAQDQLPGAAAADVPPGRERP